jgi:4'-phosphopantetheinyl transferase EntD
MASTINHPPEQSVPVDQATPERLTDYFVALAEIGARFFPCHSDKSPMWPKRSRGGISSPRQIRAMVADQEADRIDAIGMTGLAVLDLDVNELHQKDQP